MCNVIQLSFVSDDIFSFLRRSNGATTESIMSKFDWSREYTITRLRELGRGGKIEYIPGNPKKEKSLISAIQILSEPNFSDDTGYWIANSSSMVA